MSLSPLSYRRWLPPSPPCTFCGREMSGGVMFQRGESYTYWCNECALVIAASLNTYNESSDGGVGDHRAAALIQAERERVEPMVITSDAPMTIRPLGEKT